MRVICIDASLLPDEFPYENGFKLVEGDVYTVVGERKGFNVNQKFVGMCYDLLEDPNHELHSKDKFAPLSEISETEMERNYSINQTSLPSNNINQ